LFTQIAVLVHKFARVYFSYGITMRNTSSIRKNVSLCWVGNIKLVIFTCYGCQGIKCKYAIFSVKWFISIRFNIVISFIYFNMGLLHKDKLFLLYCDLDNTPDLLVYILTNEWIYVMIVCKHCYCSGSSGIVSMTNFWILILHIFIHFKGQGCRFLTVYLWCDSHWNVGNL
jgi:hypothetical protein